MQYTVQYTVQYTLHSAIYTIQCNIQNNIHYTVQYTAQYTVQHIIFQFITGCIVEKVFWAFISALWAQPQEFWATCFSFLLAPKQFSWHTSNTLYSALYSAICSAIYSAIYSAVYSAIYSAVCNIPVNHGVQCWTGFWAIHISIVSTATRILSHLFLLFPGTRIAPDVKAILLAHQFSWHITKPANSGKPNQMKSHMPTDLL